MSGKKKEDKLSAIVVETLTYLGMAQHTDRFLKLLQKANINRFQDIESMDLQKANELHLPWDLVTAVQKRIRVWKLEMNDPAEMQLDSAEQFYQRQGSPSTTSLGGAAAGAASQNKSPSGGAAPPQSSLSQVSIGGQQNSNMAFNQANNSMSPRTPSNQPPFQFGQQNQGMPGRQVSGNTPGLSPSPSQKSMMGQGMGMNQAGGASSPRTPTGSFQFGQQGQQATSPGTPSSQANPQFGQQGQQNQGMAGSQAFQFGQQGSQSQGFGIQPPKGQPPAGARPSSAQLQGSQSPGTQQGQMQNKPSQMGQAFGQQGAVTPPGTPPRTGGMAGQMGQMQQPGGMQGDQGGQASQMFDMGGGSNVALERKVHQLENLLQQAVKKIEETNTTCRNLMMKLNEVTEDQHRSQLEVTGSLRKVEMLLNKVSEDKSSQKPLTQADLDKTLYKALNLKMDEVLDQLTARIERGAQKGASGLGGSSDYSSPKPDSLKNGLNSSTKDYGAGLGGFMTAKDYGTDAAVKMPPLDTKGSMSGSTYNNGSYDDTKSRPSNEGSYVRSQDKPSWGAAGGPQDSKSYGDTKSSFGGDSKSYGGGGGGFGGGPSYNSAQESKMNNGASNPGYGYSSYR